VVGSQDGVAAIDAATGSVLFDGTGLVPASNRSVIVTTEIRGALTSLRTIEAATGNVLATATVRGRLAIRVVSGDGRRAALMAPVPAGTDPWIPTSRAATDIVVVDTSGIVPPRRYHLEGNLEPEAFSADDGSLFMIRYLPAEAPAAYRVAQLELADGDVYPVLGRRKSWSQIMSGTRLSQAASPDGTGLYTLYTSQPASYAAGFDPNQANADRPVAFVHSLSLSREFAVCVGLPKSLWGADAAEQAIAVDPDGSRVYVVDTVRDVLAVIDTWKLKVVATAHPGLGPMGTGRAAGAVSPDGSTLFVSRGARVAAIDTNTLRFRDVRSAPGPVSAMGFSRDGTTMYLGLPGEVGAVETATWASGGSIEAPNPAPPTFVSSAVA
jgi:YVTN family beta-propeller protein